jgi:hypothetical protein
MHQDALLESAPVLLRGPHRNTGRGKTLAKPFARASPTPKQPDARGARNASSIVVLMSSTLVLSILVFR